MLVEELPRMVPLLRLPGVISGVDLGPWEAFTANYKSGGRARTVSRELIYGIEHTSGVRRFVCARCSQTYPNRHACETHRKDTHGPESVGGSARFKRPSSAIEVAPTPAPPAPAEAAPEQMTIDDIGLDLAGPAFIEGVTALVSSRLNARARVKELEAENASLRAKLVRIVEILTED